MNQRIVALAPGSRRRAKRKCPICGRPAEADTRPFCSRRCADEDLRRWLAGDYRVPTAAAPDPDEPEER